MVAGINVPPSRLAKAEWAILSTGIYAGDAKTFATDYGNDLGFGAPDSNGGPYNAVLKPEDAWNVDTKLDDGRPGYGNIIATFWNNACTTPSDGSAPTKTNLDANYRIDDTSIQCTLRFIRVW